MKRTLLFFFLLSAAVAEAQTKTHNGLYQFDSLYASLQTTTDTTNYKPIGVYNNKFKRLAYWPLIGGGSLSDGDKGDITVSSSGATWTIDNLAVTNAKINDVAIGKVTGRTTYTSGKILIGDGSADATTSANLTYSSNTLTNNGITKLKGGLYVYVATLVGIDLNANLDDTYHYVNVDASLSTSQGQANVYLPNLDSKNGLRYVIKKWDSGSVPVVIYPYSGQTIEGASSKTLATQYKTITIYTDGDNSIKKWYIEYQN